MADTHKFTQELQDRFIEELRRTCNISASCRAVGISQPTARLYRNAYPAFAEAWDAAIEEGADALEQEARRRALHGIDEPVIYQGAPTILYQRDENGHILEEEYDTGATDKDGKPIIGRRPLPELDEQGRPKLLTTKAYSDTLMALLLKAHKPEKYRERTETQLTGANGGPVVLSDAERAAKLAAIINAAKARRDNQDLV